MEIVQLNEKDTEGILKLESESAPEKPDYVKYSLGDLKDLFYNPENYKVFGIFEDNQLIAWSSYRSDKDNLYEISSIVVDKNYRGQGLGKSLLEHTGKEILAGHPDAEIYLTVYPQNLNALFLYLKNNFIVYDFKKDYYGPGADRLFLKYKKP